MSKELTKQIEELDFTHTINYLTRQEELMDGIHDCFRQILEILKEEYNTEKDD